MGIESVGSRGPICTTPEDEAEATPAESTRAAPAGPPPKKDEVVEAPRESVFARARELSEDLGLESEVKGPKHAFESAQYAAPGQKDVFGKSNEGGVEHSLTLWNTGSRSIKELSHWGDSEAGGSIQLGWGQSSGKAFYENEPGKRTFGVAVGGEMAAFHGEEHLAMHLGGPRDGVDVNVGLAANVGHVAANSKVGYAFGEHGAEVQGKVDARAMLVDVAANASATIRIGHHDVGMLGAKVSAGYGAGVVAELHGKVKDGALEWTNEAGAAIGLSGSIGTSGKVNVLELAAGVADGGIPASLLAITATGEQLEAGMLDVAASASRTEQAKLAAEGHGFAAGALGLLAKGLASKADGERQVGSLFQSGSDAMAGAPEVKK